MITKRLSLNPRFLAPFVILLAPLFASCGFRVPSSLGIPCQYFESIPLTPLGDFHISHPVPGVDTPGTIIALHGSGSAKGPAQPGSGGPIKVEQSVTVPTWANRATVFLNGWHLSYLGGDHHVLGLGTMIGKIRINLNPITKETTLTWNAMGWIEDDSNKEGYNLSYNFTVLFWQNSNLDAAVDHGNVVVDAVDPSKQYCSDDGQISDNYYDTMDDNTNTALSNFFSFIQNNAFAISKTVAVLPRGFEFQWTDSDHHLLQLAYNLDHSEIFADSKKKYNIKSRSQGAPVPTGASLVGAGFVSWDTYAIFKDDETRRDYYFGEIVSGMGGNDVGVVQPPFSILPSRDGGLHQEACLLPSGSITSEEVVIENVPFEYAVPMLTGWELAYGECDHDHHVREIGILIDSWSYQPPAGGAGGTLRYTLFSDLHDDSHNYLGRNSHKVTVLGFRPVSGVTIKGGPASGR